MTQKFFRIVEVIGNEGFHRYYVEHRVQLLGFNLWWSGTWLYHGGGANYDMSSPLLEEARETLALIRRDYRKKRERMKKETVLEVIE